MISKFNALEKQTKDDLSRQKSLLSTTASPDMISKFNALEKQTKDDLSRQKSLISNIQDNYSFLSDKIRQLEAGSNKTIPKRISSERFVFDSA